MRGPVNGINAFIIQEQPTHSGRMRPNIVLHQEEPRAHCTSIRSDNHSEDFILVPNSSQGTVGYDLVVCTALQGYASSDHHQPTTKLAMMLQAA